VRRARCGGRRRGGPAVTPGLPPPPDSGRPQIGLPDFAVPPLLRLALSLGLFGNYLRSGIENTALPLVGNAYGLSAAKHRLRARTSCPRSRSACWRSPGRLFDRIPPARCLAVALLLGIGAVVVLATVQDLRGFLVAAALFGVVDGVALSAPPVLIVALSPNASTGVATYRIACGVGSFLGSGSVNLLIAMLGAAGGLAVVSGVLAVGVVLARSTGRRIAPGFPRAWLTRRATRAGDACRNFKARRAIARQSWNDLLAIPVACGLITTGVRQVRR